MPRRGSRSEKARAQCGGLNRLWSVFMFGDTGFGLDFAHYGCYLILRSMPVLIFRDIYHCVIDLS